jgi:hypothetical protein
MKGRGDGQLSANDEGLERLPPSLAMIGPIQLTIRKADGTLVAIDTDSASRIRSASDRHRRRIHQIKSEINCSQDWTHERWRMLKTLAEWDRLTVIPRTSF